MLRRVIKPDLCLSYTPWLGRQDSNLRMPVPKTGALPLGDAPLRIALTRDLPDLYLIIIQDLCKFFNFSVKLALIVAFCFGGYLSEPDYLFITTLE